MKFSQGSFDARGASDRYPRRETLERSTSFYSGSRVTTLQLPIYMPELTPPAVPKTGANLARLPQWNKRGVSSGHCTRCIGDRLVAQNRRRPPACTCYHGPRWHWTSLVFGEGRILIPRSGPPRSHFILRYTWSLAHPSTHPHRRRTQNSRPGAPSSPAPKPTRAREQDLQPALEDRL